MEVKKYLIGVARIDLRVGVEGGRTESTDAEGVREAGAV